MAWKSPSERYVYRSRRGQAWNDPEKVKEVVEARRIRRIAEARVAGLRKDREAARREERARNPKPLQSWEDYLKDQRQGGGTS